MTDKIIEFDGRIWVLEERGVYSGYAANFGSMRNPRPKALTRYVWEKAHGRPAPGWKVKAIDGSYLNWKLENLRLEYGDPEYVERDTARRDSMNERDGVLALMVLAGWDHDDAWDAWRGAPYHNYRPLDLV